MELKHLEYFLSCARNSSLTLAAEELYTTQPHVSMVIKSLEKELGVTLFHRKSKGIELTEEGKQIYSYAVNALKNAELIKLVSQSQKKHTVLIATNNSSNMAVLLTNYFKQFQQGQLFLKFTECGIEKMLTLLSYHEYDLGFLFVPDNKRSALRYMLEKRHLEFVPLLDTDLVLYVGKNNPLFGQKSIEPEKLLELDFIQLEDDFFTVEDLLDSVPSYRTKKPYLNRVVMTNSDHMMLRMLEQTNLCNLGSYWLKDMYRQYDFQRISIQGMERRITFGYIYYKSKEQKEEVKSFLHFVKKILELDI